MLKDMTRGGQTFLHNFRMLKQIVYVLSGWYIFLFLSTFTLSFYLQTNPFDYYYCYKIIEAKFTNLYSQLYLYLNYKDIYIKSQLMQFTDLQGQKIQLYAYQFLAKNETYLFIDKIKQLTQTCAYIGLGVSSFIISFIGVFLYKRGRKLSNERHVRGSQLAESSTLKQQIEATGEISSFSIANIPLPKNTEIQHILSTGTTGSGKTVMISELLRQIRQQKRRALVYCKMGSFVERFYRPGKDIILNPLDERCLVWNLWAECRTDAHFDSIAESLIPMAKGTQDPFWVMAARIMFAVAARRLKQRGEMNTQQLLRYLLMSELDHIKDLVANTEAESLVSEKAEKMALSVKAVLSAYLKPLRYLKEGSPIFSIREWFEKEKDDSWIFVTSRGDQHATLKPLISAWLDIAANAITSLPPDLNRRIFMVLDETDSLQYMPSLIDFVTQSRQFGGCGVFTVQAISQFYKNFGEEDAETLISCCNTGIHFRSRGKKTASYIAELLDEKEIEELNENISYGAEHVRDGISLNKHNSLKKIVLSSQIKQLNDLEAYLQLKGDWPVTKIKFDYVDYPKKELAFIPREVALDPSIDQLFKSIHIQAMSSGVAVPNEATSPVTNPVVTHTKKKVNNRIVEL